MGRRQNEICSAKHILSMLMCYKTDSVKDRKTKGRKRGTVMKFKKKIKKLLLTTGMVLALGLLATGCGKKEVVPAESTQVETVVETQDPYSLGNKDVHLEETTVASDTLALNESETVEVGVYASGDKSYTFDRYGDLGKGVFDGVATQWVNWVIEDEPALRTVMDETYGALPTKEELTQEILDMQRTDRGLTAQHTPQETQAQVAETKTQVAETQVAETKALPTETKAPVAETKAPVAETQPAPVETQAPTPQQTEPAPTQAPTQADPNDGFAEHRDEILASQAEKVRQPGSKAPDYDVDEPLQNIQWN